MIVVCMAYERIFVVGAALSAPPTNFAVGAALSLFPCANSHARPSLEYLDLERTTWIYFTNPRGYNTKPFSNHPSNNLTHIL